MKKIFMLLLCLTVLLRPVSVSANSAQTNWRGVDGTGALVVGESSPIVVEHEELVFDIAEFPLEYYLDEAGFLSYSATATACYSFYNPSDYEVTVSLAFPFGSMPDYADYYYNAVDWEKYTVRVDGMTVDKTVRHTLTALGSGFSLERDLPLLYDGYVEDDFYYPDLPVSVYVFRPDLDFSDNASVFAAIEFEFDPEKTRACLTTLNNAETLASCVRMSGFVHEGEVCILYIFGEQDEPPEWKLYKDNSCAVESDDSMKLLAAEEMTFEEMVTEKLPQDPGVSMTDWYNAVVASANQSLMNYGVLSMNFILDGTYNPARYLMQWFTYELTFAPGQRIVNEVTVPIYPSIDADYEPSVYEYTYLLSPASTWADFGTLDIQINTPYYIVEDEEFGFEKTDEGYRVSVDGLPEGELEFSLSTDPEPKEDSFDLRDLAYLAMFLCGVTIKYGWPVILIGVLLLIFRKHWKTNMS